MADPRFFLVIGACAFAGLYWALGARTVAGRLGRIAVVAILLVLLPIGVAGVLMVHNAPA